jgi:hypothetical protein
VHDVAGDDGQTHVAVDRDVQVVDRDVSVRVVELPVELVALDLDLERGGRLRRRRDLRQEDEDGRADDREDDDRDHRPDQLELRVAVHLRALEGPRAAAGAVADDEHGERRHDDDEDRRRESEDHPVGGVDVLDVRGMRVLRLEAAVGGRGDGRRGEGRNGGHGE